MAVQSEARTVQVQQVNGHGFKSTAGDWFNVSKYAQPADIVMPRVGDRVTVSLDRSGFVRKVEAIAPAATPAPASAPVPTSHNGVQGSPPIVQDDHGIVATRLAVLAAAVAILTSGGGAATEEDALILAERLEAWATR